MHEIAQLMRHGSQAFIQRPDPFSLRFRFSLVRVFRNSIGDAIVETAIERPKLIYLDRRTALESQIRYRLAQITVVVNNLVNSQSPLQQLAPVQRSGRADLGQCQLAPARWTGNPATSHRLRAPFNLQSLDELVKEQRDAVGNIGVSHLGRVPLSKLASAPVDQVNPVSCEEFV